VDVLPWQKADLEPLDLLPKAAARAAWWIEGPDRRKRGHRAIGSALVACGGYWRPFGRLLLLPPPVAWLAAAAYAVVAGVRGFLPGITPACEESYAWDAARDRDCGS
jgi:hypothetical protein